ATSDRWMDARPLVPGSVPAGPITDHGELVGLADSADHAYALLINGTRALTGAWAANNDITGLTKLEVDNLRVDGNTISAISGAVFVTSATGNVLIGSSSNDVFISATFSKIQLLSPNIELANLAGDVLVSFNGNVNDGTLTYKTTEDEFRFASLVQATQLKSTIATGTAPLIVASTTVVSNLNVDLLDGKHETDLLLLAGRAGGQDFAGGTGAGENLEMRSTVHGTKGKIVFGAAGSSVYDEVNDRLGLGTASPQQHLHISRAVPIIRLSDSNAATDQAVATLIEFYRGDNTSRVGYWGMASWSNDVMVLATDYPAGEIRLSTGSAVTALMIDSSQNFDFQAGNLTTTGTAALGATTITGNLTFNGSRSILTVASNQDISVNPGRNLFLGTDQADNVYLGRTSGAIAVTVQGPTKLLFRDSGLHIYSSVDGQLDIVADTVLAITAPSVTLSGDLALADDKDLRFGASTDAIMVWEISGARHHLALGLATGTAAQSGYFLIMQKADIGNVNRIPAALANHPVLRIYSQDAGQADDWIQFYHNAGDGVIDWGNGVLEIKGGTLELSSTTGAFLNARLTTTQRNALTAVDGMQIYNTTTGEMNYRKAGAWVAI
ncbi:hypothetical protein LCGC14_1663040, partial [marine sediment metagenome]